MFALITVSFLFISESIANENCLEENAINKPVLARYEIKTQVGNKTESKLFTIVRSENRVAYSSGEVIEVWEKTSNNKIKLYKFFNQAERGIEYQPVDIVNVDNIDWNAKRQLVSDRFTRQFELVKQKSKNCKLHQLYRSQTRASKQHEGGVNNRLEKKESLKIIWISSVKLPAIMKHKRYNAKTSWELVELEKGADKASEFMKRLDGFSLIDYSDIGDNESDPFLQKMINLGFVAHSDPFYYSSKTGIYSEPSHSKNHEHGHAH